MADEISEALQAMEANEPQANLYSYAEEYVSDLTYELMGIGDDDDFNELVELVKQAVIDGAQWQKQQMMKNAVDGLYIHRNRYTKKNVLNGFDVTCEAVQQFKKGDKVKLIIIKED